MFWSSLTYILYVGANIKVIPIVLYISGILLGFGAACIWTAQSTFVQHCANYYENSNNFAINSNLGYFNGIFFLVYSMNRCVGNMSAAIVFDSNESNTFMYVVLTILGFIGCCGFCFIKLRTHYTHGDIV